MHQFVVNICSGIILKLIWRKYYDLGSTLVVLLYLPGQIRRYWHRFHGWYGCCCTFTTWFKPGAIRLTISVIMSVIMAIAAMQVAGGMDFLVKMAEKSYVKIQNTSLSLRQR